MFSLIIVIISSIVLGFGLNNLMVAILRSRYRHHTNWDVIVSQIIVNLMLIVIIIHQSIKILG